MVTNSRLRTGVKEASLKPRKIYLGWEDGTHNQQQRGALDAKEDDAEEIIWVVVCQDVAPYGEHQRASIKQHFERSGLLKALLRHRARRKCTFAGNMKVGRNIEKQPGGKKSLQNTVVGRCVHVNRSPFDLVLEKHSVIQRKRNAQIKPQQWKY